MTLIAILVPCLAGYFVVYLFFPIHEHSWRIDFLKISLAPGIGFGLTSAIQYVCIGCRSPYPFAAFVAEILTLILALSCIALRGRVGNCGNGEDLFCAFGPVRSRDDLSRWIKQIFALVMAMGVVTFVYLSINSPHGSWDARAIWNYRARMIFRDVNGWREAYGQQAPTSHTDYPLLLPLSVVRVWLYSGRESLLAPVCTAMIFTFSTAILLVSSVSFFRGKTQGYLAGLSLLAIPLFLQEGASQYADVPVGYYFLSAMVLYCCHEAYGNRSKGFLILTGLTSGFSAWTKNEGILFVAVLLGAGFVTYICRRKTTAGLREVALFLLGLMPVALLVLHFKVRLAPKNDLLSTISMHSVIEKLLEINRHKTILMYLADQITKPEKCGILPLIALPYFYLARKPLRGEAFNAAMFMFLVIAGMSLGYLFIYLTTFQDLSWHLKTSMNRLMVQLAPSFLLLFYLSTNAPEEVVAEYKGKGEQKI